MTAADLLEFEPARPITEAGLRTNISVGIQYLEAWLGGQGCVPIYNLMEDAATAEISRAQVWQWIRSPEGRARRRAQGDPGDGRGHDSRGDAEDPRRCSVPRSAKGGTTRRRRLFAELVNNDTFVEFLTLPAYERLD